MNLPEAIPSVQTNTEEVCPQSLNFISGEDIEDFSLTIKNAGDDGTLYVLLSSDNFLIRKDEYEEFSSNSTEKWFVSSQNSQTFDFEIRKNSSKEEIENFTINAYYGCYKQIFGSFLRNCKQSTKSCYYEKENSYSYKLISET